MKHVAIVRADTPLQTEPENATPPEFLDGKHNLQRYVQLIWQIYERRRIEAIDRKSSVR